MARLKNTGIFTVLEFPLLREGDGTEIERCTWKARYPTRKPSTPSARSWATSASAARCFCKSCRKKARTYYPEDIHYYDDPPFDDGNYLAHGVDLAISTKESADYTAIVRGEVTWPAGKLEIYIQPHPVIRHMTFSDTMAALDNIRQQLE